MGKSELSMGNNDDDDGDGDKNNNLVALLWSDLFICIYGLGG